MVSLVSKSSSRWKLDVERGPDWLYVRLHPGEGDPTDPTQFSDLAERLWNLAEQHFTYRLVLEMEDVTFLPSSLMGQLVMLQKRTLNHGGFLKLCGLSESCQQALHFCRLDQALPCFANREDAVLGDSFFAHPR